MYDQDAYRDDCYLSSRLLEPFSATVAPSVTEHNPPRKSVKSRLGVRIQGHQDANDENVLIGQDPKYIPSHCNIRTRTLPHSRTLSPLRTNHGLINSPLQACPSTPLRDEESWIVVDEVLATPGTIVKEWDSPSIDRSFPLKQLAENIAGAIDDLRTSLRTVSPGQANPVADRFRQTCSSAEAVPGDKIDLRSRLRTVSKALPEAVDCPASSDLPNTLSVDLRSRLSRKISPNPDDQVDRIPKGTFLQGDPDCDVNITNNDCNQHRTPPLGTRKPTSKILVHWVEDVSPAVPEKWNDVPHSPTNTPLEKRRCTSLRGCNKRSPIRTNLSKKLFLSRSPSAKSITSGLSGVQKVATVSKTEAPQKSINGKVLNSNARVSSIPVNLTKKSLSSLPAWAQLGISDYLGENKSKEGSPPKKTDVHANRRENPAADIARPHSTQKLTTSSEKVVSPPALCTSTDPPAKDTSAEALVDDNLITSQEKAKAVLPLSPSTMSKDSPKGDSSPSQQYQKQPDGTGVVEEPKLEVVSSLERQEGSADRSVRIEVAKNPKKDFILSRDKEKPMPDIVTKLSSSPQTDPSPAPQPDTTSKGDGDLSIQSPSYIPQIENFDEDSGFGSMILESSSPSPDSTTPPVQDGIQEQALTDNKESKTLKCPIETFKDNVKSKLDQPPSDNKESKTLKCSIKTFKDNVKSKLDQPPSDNKESKTLKCPIKTFKDNVKSKLDQLPSDNKESKTLKCPIKTFKDNVKSKLDQPPSGKKESKTLKHPSQTFKDSDKSKLDRSPSDSTTPPVQDGIRKQTLTDNKHRKTLKRPIDALKNDEVDQPPPKKNLVRDRPSKKARKLAPFDTTASLLPSRPVTRLQMDLDQLLLSIRRVFLINHMTYSDLHLEMERDTCVAAMKGTTQAYSHFNLVKKEGRQDFSCWQVRWGYVFMYLMRHAHLVFLSLKHLHLSNQQPSAQMTRHWKIPFDSGGVYVNAFLQKCAIPGRVLRVVAIGGGPGSDLIGLAMFLRANNFPVRIRAVVFDRCGHWSKSWEDLHHELPPALACYFEPVEYVPFDYLYSELSRLHLGFIASADLITIIKSMSPVATKLWHMKPMRLPGLGLVKAHSLFNILSSVASGAMVLYVDNKNGQQNRVMQETVQSIPGYTVVHYETTTEKLPGRGGFSPLCQKFMKWVGYGPSFSSGNNEIVALSRRWKFEY